MKTKKFFMTSLLVMGMIIAKAATGFPPELVLVSQPVLTYNANSVTLYYDVQNIGDYTYRGDVVIYLDPDNGYPFASEYVRVSPGRIKRIAVSIPAYRANPSWTYTVMPYYELDGELYSFTTFEYFEPLRFCWYGYHNEPWVVIKVGPRPRYYYRPGTYRYYYDGYRPMMPPPPPGHNPHHGPHDMPPMNAAHHTYSYHHSNGGYPANYHPEAVTPGYNHAEPEKPKATVHPHGSNTPGSMSSNGAGNNSGNSNVGTANGNGGATTRPSGNNSGSVTPPANTGNNGASTRPSGNDNGSSSTRPSGNSNSGSVSRPSSNSGNSTGTSNSGRSGSSGSDRRSSSSSNDRSSSSSSSDRSSSSSDSGRSGNSSSRSSSSPSRGR